MHPLWIVTIILLVGCLVAVIVLFVVPLFLAARLVDVIDRIVATPFSDDSNDKTIAMFLPAALDPSTADIVKIDSALNAESSLPLDVVIYPGGIVVKTERESIPFGLIKQMELVVQEVVPSVSSSTEDQRVFVNGNSSTVSIQPCFLLGSSLSTELVQEISSKFNTLTGNESSVGYAVEIRFYIDTKQSDVLFKDLYEAENLVKEVTTREGIVINSMEIRVLVRVY
jgi:hypothetical protein